MKSLAKLGKNEARDVKKEFLNEKNELENEEEDDKSNEAEVKESLDDDLLMISKELHNTEIETLQERINCSQY